MVFALGYGDDEDDDDDDDDDDEDDDEDEEESEDDVFLYAWKQLLIILIYSIFFSFIIHINPEEDHHFTCPAPPIFKYTLSSHIHTNTHFFKK